MKSNEEILSDAIKRFDENYSYEYDNRKDAEISSKFIDGKQWPDEMIKSRQTQNRPCLTINKLRKFIINTTGEIQQNRPGIKVVPIDDVADLPGAEIRNDLIRHIEISSNSDMVYDSALRSALEGGYGYWRIVTEYDKDSFDQNIVLKIIPNRFSVIMDQSSEMPSYEDSEYAFIMTNMSKDEFKKLYPDKETSTFKEISGVEKWFSDDKITVAEYFWKEYYDSEMWKLSDGTILKEEDISNLKETDALEDILPLIIKKRTVKNHKVYWAKLTANEIIDGPKEFPSNHIPIIPMLAYEFNDNGKRRFRSMVHDSLDAMRMYNYWKTHGAESIAIAPKSPMLLTPRQIEGHEDKWNVSNVIPFPYLLYNPDPSSSPPFERATIQATSASISEAQAAASDIQDTIGIYPAALGQPSNERSGRAILARQKKSDNIIFTLVNNFQKSLVYSHQIILEMIPKVYSEERIIKTITKDGEVNELKLNYPNTDLVTLAHSISNDMTAGKYKMTPVVGANYATKRQEQLASMLDFVQFVPQLGMVLAPDIAKLMDWEGADSISQRIEEFLQQNKDAKK